MAVDARRSAVFLDRDGTLTVERGYVTKPAQLRLVAGAGGALAGLAARGYRLVVVTNQSAVARGLLDEAGLADIHAELRRRLRRRGVELDAIYHCPHHPTEGLPPLRRRCGCRKPAAGLLRRAARELGLDLGASFVVGDGLRDVEAALRAGARPLLVRTGHGQREAAAVRRTHPGVPVVADIGAAAAAILSDRRRRR